MVNPHIFCILIYTDFYSKLPKKSGSSDNSGNGEEIINKGSFKGKYFASLVY
jgi:hypothetical protein